MSEQDCIERWLNIPGFPNYQVSDLGKVRSYYRRGGRTNRGGLGKKWIVLKGGLLGGYPCVELKRADGINRKVFVHRLVLEVFTGPCPVGFEACHRDDNKLNSCLNNLYWGTRHENHADRRRNGRVGVNRLSATNVLNIRLKIASGSTLAILAKEYGVHQSTISAINLRRNWKHI